uniref:Uncharacterized protein n=1 Tax=Cacopsylla melanoneura TaxID=428564 RepID=A0A8D8Z1N4_9HEMI
MSSNKWQLYQSEKIMLFSLEILETVISTKIVHNNQNNSHIFFFFFSSIFLVLTLLSTGYTYLFVEYKTIFGHLKTLTQTNPTSDGLHPAVTVDQYPPAPANS